MALVLREFDVDSIENCTRLADMFNDWDAAWPGGFTRGVKWTGAQVQADERRAQHLAALVVKQDEDGEIVAYCNLEAQPGQKDLAYIGLLGARPSAHGKGAGKMLLREMVRRVTDYGYKQVTLHTWAGNTKAVPLYKKTGFQWVPETDVFMRNWLPSILNMPLVQTFLDGQDWYDCLERDLTVAPDDVKWNGMKAYPYRFRNGDRTLSLVFDAAGEGLTGLETDAYALSCEIGVEDAPAGQAYPITWRLTSKTGRPLDVVLLAEAAPGLRLSVQESLNVSDTLCLTRELYIESDTPPTPKNVPAPCVITTLLVNGQPIVLQTGVKVVRPVMIACGGQRLSPGREQKVTVLLHSRMLRDLTGTLALNAVPGLRCESPVKTFTLPAKSRTQCVFSVSAEQAGALSTSLILEADGLRVERPVTFRALDSTSALGSVDAWQEQVILESMNTRVVNNLRGGSVDIADGPELKDMITLETGELGPPFLEVYLTAPLHPARIERGPNGDRITVTSMPPAMPGLRLERTVSLLSEGLVRVEYQIYNTTGAPITAKLRQKCWSGLNGHLAVPLPNGILREPINTLNDYPNGEYDVLTEGESLAENWIANEEDGFVCGVVFTGQPVQDMRWTRLVHLTYDLGEIPAYGVHTIPPIYMVGTSGTWQTVRGWWKRLVQTPPADAPEAEEELAPPETRRVLEIDIQPRLLTRDEQSVTFTVTNCRSETLDATLTLSADVAFAPASIELVGVNRARPHSGQIEASTSLQTGAQIITATINSVPVAQTRKIGLVRLGSEGEVRVTRSEATPETTENLIAVNNGLLQFQVAPAFLGAIVALEQQDGINHLRTCYPTPQPFIWANPWYGGIHPFLDWPGDPRLTRETWTGETVMRTGATGIEWQGVKVQCRPAHKDLNWLQLEAEYLTTPYSNVIALVMRCANLTDARMQSEGSVGIAAWLNVGGAYNNAIAHAEFAGERQARTRGGFGMDNNTGMWKAVENGDTGQTLLLLATAPGHKAVLEDFAEEGAHLGVGGKIDLPPRQTTETVAWLVCCANSAEIEPYALALSACRALP